MTGSDYISSPCPSLNALKTMRSSRDVHLQYLSSLPSVSDLYGIERKEEKKMARGEDALPVYDIWI